MSSKEEVLSYISKELPSVKIVEVSDEENFSTEYEFINLEIFVSCFQKTNGTQLFFINKDDVIMFFFIGYDMNNLEDSAVVKCEVSLS